MKSICIRGVSLTAACLISTGALACPASDFNTTIFFTSLPTKVDAPVVAAVRVVKVVNPQRGGYSYTGHARVEKVIKGTIKGEVIALIARPKSLCDATQNFRIGDGGIVIGTVRYDAGDLPQLEAIAESFKERRMREGGTQ
jgi:hypothetical protein